MALTRFNGNVVPFANDATSTNRTVFGGTAQSDALDDNLNADFKKGWEIVGLNDNPTREDFNAMGYTLGALISYLYQMGIAEYNASQEYKLNALCIGTDGTIYQSLVNANIGNALNNGTKWKNVTGSYVKLTEDQTIAGVKTFSSNPISSATQSTNSNALTKYSSVVKNTGDETIAGIKTFSSSPIVPTPTTGTQAANKDYADLKVALASFIGTNQSLSGNGYQKFPGGLIIQWGTNASGAVTFPIAFPTNCSGIYTGLNTPVATQTSKAHMPTVSNKTTTSFTLGYIDYMSPAVTNYSWLAIGY